MKILDTVRMQPIEKKGRNLETCESNQTTEPKIIHCDHRRWKIIQKRSAILKKNPKQTSKQHIFKKKENSDEETVPECSQDGKTELTTVVQTPPETNSKKMERPPDLPEENLTYTRGVRLIKKPKRYQDN